MGLPVLRPLRRLRSVAEAWSEPSIASGPKKDRRGRPGGASGSGARWVAGRTGRRGWFMSEVHGTEVGWAPKLIAMGSKPSSDGLHH